MTIKKLEELESKYTKEELREMLREFIDYLEKEILLIIKKEEQNGRNSYKKI